MTQTTSPSKQLIYDYLDRRTLAVDAPPPTTPAPPHQYLAYR